MARKATGNLNSLNAYQLKQINKLWGRKIEASEIVSLAVAREMYDLATQLRRMIALIINRDGDIEEIVIGNKEIFYLPDLGRYRVSKGLRNLRLIFTDLSNSPTVSIPDDVMTDLEKLRFDMVCGYKPLGDEIIHKLAYITPNTETYTTQHSGKNFRFSNDLLNFFREIESVVNQATKAGSNSNLAIIVGAVTNYKDERRLRELKELAETAGFEIADIITQKREADTRTVLGSGKLEEVILRALRLGVDTLIFNQELKPAQWRVITNSTELKILDRSMVILDIFAQRAVSSEGRIQVELAQLKYNLPRLTDRDSGLSRLAGGIGGRGPGETKLEVSRRQSRQRIQELESKISRFGDNRDLRAKRRAANRVPLVAIIGYTNAGKSTLFKTLTKADTFVANKLFATLDTCKRKYFLEGKYLSEAELSACDDTISRTEGYDYRQNGMEIIMVDTVGFIEDLPEELFNAFRATLDELLEADLLIHLIDTSLDDMLVRKREVEKILEKELGIVHQNLLLVGNKVDCGLPENIEALRNDVVISAKKKLNIDDLLSAIGIKLLEKFLLPLC